MATKKEPKFVTVYDELTHRVIATFNIEGKTAETEKGFKVDVSDKEPTTVRDEITGSVYLTKEK